MASRHLAPRGPAGRRGAAARLHLADPARHLLRHRPAGPAGGQRPGPGRQLARPDLVARLPLRRAGRADGGCHGGQYRHRRRHRPGAAGGCAAAHRRRDAAADAGRLGAGAAVADRQRQHRQPHRPCQPPGAGHLQQPRHPLGQLRDRLLGQEPLAGGGGGAIRLRQPLRCRHGDADHPGLGRQYLFRHARRAGKAGDPAAESGDRPARAAGDPRPGLGRHRHRAGTGAAGNRGGAAAGADPAADAGGRDQPQFARHPGGPPAAGDRPAGRHLQRAGRTAGDPRPARRGAGPPPRRAECRGDAGGGQCQYRRRRGRSCCPPSP